MWRFDHEMLLRIDLAAHITLRVESLIDHHKLAALKVEYLVPWNVWNLHLEEDSQVVQ
jgi:hypothetical protein